MDVVGSQASAAVLSEHLISRLVIGCGGGLLFLPLNRKDGWMNKWLDGGILKKTRSGPLSRLKIMVTDGDEAYYKHK